MTRTPPPPGTGSRDRTTASRIPNGCRAPGPAEPVRPGPRRHRDPARGPPDTGRRRLGGAAPRRRRGPGRGGQPAAGVGLGAARDGGRGLAGRADGAVAPGRPGAAVRPAHPGRRGRPRRPRAHGRPDRRGPVPARRGRRDRRGRGGGGSHGTPDANPGTERGAARAGRLLGRGHGGGPGRGARADAAPGRRGGLGRGPPAVPWLTGAALAAAAGHWALVAAAVTGAVALAMACTPVRGAG